jgi:hypothetical protein
LSVETVRSPPTVHPFGPLTKEDTTMEPLEVNLLGAPEVRRAGRVCTPRTRKALALLAYLASDVRHPDSCRFRGLSTVG